MASAPRAANGECKPIDNNSNNDSDNDSDNDNDSYSDNDSDNDSDKTLNALFPLSLTCFICLFFLVI